MPTKQRPESLAIRLLQGGLPAILASGVASLVPLLGSVYVSTTEYAIWALGATLSTIFIVFDFGSPSLATKLASTDQLTRSASIKLSFISLIPPLVLGIVAVVVWPWYGRQAGLDGLSDSTVLPLFILIAVGCALRSVGLVYAASALGSGSYARRGLILIGGASVNLASTLLCLTAGMGVQSLGYGVLSAGFVQAVLGLTLGYRMLPSTSLSRHVSREVDRLIGLFLRSKGLVTLLGLGITQLDRWAVGLIGNPHLLAQYDIATRVLVMPKVALVAIAAGLIAEGGRAKAHGHVSELLRKSELLLYVVSPIATIAAGAFAILMQLSLEPAMNIWILTGVLSAAHLANMMTIPSVYILTGMGRPDFELRYLIPLASITTAVYGASIILTNGQLFVVGWAVSMFGCSLFFLAKRKLFIKESFK